MSMCLKVWVLTTEMKLLPLNHTKYLLSKEHLEFLMASLSLS